MQLRSIENSFLLGLNKMYWIIQEKSIFLLQILYVRSFIYIYIFVAHYLFITLSDFRLFFFIGPHF